MPKVGDKAPDFSLTSTDGTIVKLSDFKGQKIILYFYPKDDTPGCTKEACDFRDNYSELKKFAVLLGVSADNNKSHNKFTEKHSLPFPLLSDESKEMLTSYGVWTQKSMFGKKYMGIQRSTFLINEQGNIDFIWHKVSVATHIKDVLKELKK